MPAFAALVRDAGGSLAGLRLVSSPKRYSALTDAVHGPRQEPRRLTTGYKTVCIARSLEWPGRGTGTPCGVFFSHLTQSSEHLADDVDVLGEA